MAIIFFLIVGVIVGLVIDSIGKGLAIGAVLYFVTLAIRVALSYRNPASSMKYTPQNTVLKQFHNIAVRNVSSVMKKYREAVKSNSPNPLRDTAASFFKIDSSEMPQAAIDGLSSIEGIVYALSSPNLGNTMALRVCQFCSLVKEELDKYPDKPATSQQQLEAAYKLLGVYDLYIQRPELFTNHVTIY